MVALRPISQADAQALVNAHYAPGRLPQDCDWFIDDISADESLKSLDEWDEFFYLSDMTPVLLVGIRHPQLVQMELF